MNQFLQDDSIVQYTSDETFTKAEVSSNFYFTPQHDTESISGDAALLPVLLRLEKEGYEQSSPLSKVSNFVEENNDGKLFFRLHQIYLDASSEYIADSSICFVSLAHQNKMESSEIDLVHNHHDPKHVTLHAPPGTELELVWKKTDSSSYDGIVHIGIQLRGKENELPFGHGELQLEEEEVGDTLVTQSIELCDAMGMGLGTAVLQIASSKTLFPREEKQDLDLDLEEKPTSRINMTLSKPMLTKEVIHRYRFSIDIQSVNGFSSPSARIFLQYAYPPFGKTGHGKKKSFLL